MMNKDHDEDDERTQSFVALTKDTEVSHYTIIDKIGSGGMGDVYLAWDTELERTVALKFLHPHLCKNDDCRKRFKREAQAAARLDHANIVSVHEVGEFRNRPYIVMQHVEGHSLRHVIKQGKLSLQQVIDLATQICEGLHEAHELGIVHRDIKPSNILLDARGNPKLVDFGLATIVGTDKLTKTGSTLGTVGYMSPEQAEGKEVDQRSDLFSLGVVLYEMITGRRPFDRDSDVATSKAIVTDIPEPLARYKANVPEELQQIVDRALDKNIETRYQTASGMLADLKRIQQAGSQTRKRKLGLWAAALVVLIAVIGYFLIDKFPVIPKSDSNGWQNSVAVLVFRNLSGDPERDIFCEGMTDEIIGRLTTIKSLKVTSMQSMLRFKESDLDLKKIGKDLKVDHILEGNIQQSGDVMRVRAQLIRVEDDANIWTENYERDVDEVFTLQDDVSRAIAAALKVTLVGNEPSFVARRGTDNIEAYNAYVKGRFLWRKRTEEDILAAIESFEQAIALDSNYAAAWSGLADAWWTLPEYGNVTRAVAYPHWEPAAVKALELDGNLAEAHASMGNIYRHKGEYEEAEREYLRAIELNPGYPWSHHWYAKGLSSQGREDERRAQQQIAYELDPLSLPVLSTMASYSRRDREPKKAIEYCERALEIGSRMHWIYLYLALAHLDVGDTAEALESVERLIRDQPDFWRSYYLKGDLMWRLRQNEKALEAYRTAVKVAPERWEPHYGLGDFLHRPMYRYEEAEKYFKRAIELDSTQSAPHIRYGVLLWWMGRTSEADEQHRRAVELAPYSAEANRAYGYFLASGIGEYKRGLEYLEKAVKLNPRHARSYVSLSWAAAMTGDFDRALWAVGKASDMDPNYRRPYYRRSEIFALAGMLDSAVFSAKEYLALEPHNEQALWRLGGIYIALRKYEQSDSVYALLAAHPDSVVRANAWRQRAYALSHQGRFREAIELMEAARKEVEARLGYTGASYSTLKAQGEIYVLFLEDPHSAFARYDSACCILDSLTINTPQERTVVKGGRAWAMAAAGDIETARTTLESDIRRLDPSETELLQWTNFYLSAVYRCAGEHDRACQTIRRALEGRQYFQIQVQAGFCYFDAGRYGEAISMLEPVLSKYEETRYWEPDWAVLAHYYLGQAYEAAGRKADAIKQYETFLDIWKNADEGLKSVEDARQRLENLKRKI